MKWLQNIFDREPEMDDIEGLTQYIINKFKILESKYGYSLHADYPPYKANKYHAYHLLEYKNEEIGRSLIVSISNHSFNCFFLNTTEVENVKKKDFEQYLPLRYAHKFFSMNTSDGSSFNLQLSGAKTVTDAYLLLFEEMDDALKGEWIDPVAFHSDLFDKDFFKHKHPKEKYILVNGIREKFSFLIEEFGFTCSRSSDWQPFFVTVYESDYVEYAHDSRMAINLKYDEKEEAFDISLHQHNKATETISGFFNITEEEVMGILDAEANKLKNRIK